MRPQGAALRATRWAASTHRPAEGRRRPSTVADRRIPIRQPARRTPLGICLSASVRQREFAQMLCHADAPVDRRAAPVDGRRRPSARQPWARIRASTPGCAPHLHHRTGHRRHRLPAQVRSPHDTRRNPLLPRLKLLPARLQAGGAHLPRLRRGALRYRRRPRRVLHPRRRPGGGPQGRTRLPGRNRGARRRAARAGTLIPAYNRVALPLACPIPGDPCA